MPFSVFVYLQLTDFSLLFFLQFTYCAFHNIQDRLRDFLITPCKSQSFQISYVICFAVDFSKSIFSLRKKKFGQWSAVIWHRSIEIQRLSFRAESASFVRQVMCVFEPISHFKLCPHRGHSQRKVKTTAEDESTLKVQMSQLWWRSDRQWASTLVMGPHSRSNEQHWESPTLPTNEVTLDCKPTLWPLNWIY